MSYFGVSTRNGVGLGLGTVPSLTNTPLGYRLAPSLNLSFAGSDALSPAITFSRTTNATLTNSAGLVANAPMNLLTFSEQFDNAFWIKLAGAVTANATVAPNGTTTADLFVPTAASAFHQIYSADVTTTSAAYSVYLKAGGYSKAALRESASQGSYIAVDLTAGTILQAANVGTGTVSGATITAVGNGWYRVSGVFTAPAAALGVVPLPNSYTSGSVSTAWTANGTSGIYIWGAQLELGSTATTYNPTTVKNLLGFTENFDNAAWTKSNSFVQTNLLTYSQDFDNAAWGKTLSSVTANTVLSPDGSLTADTVTASGAYGNVKQTPATTASSITISVFAKAGNFGKLEIIATSNVDSFPNFTAALFDITNGTYVSQRSGGTGYSISSYSITAVGDGWYRLVVSATVTAGSAQGVVLGLGVNAVSGNTVYIWGAQLVQGTSAGDYKATYAAAAAVGYTDIYGQPFAQKLVETTGTGAHLVQQTFSAGAAPVTSTYYMKAAERSIGYVRIFDNIAGAGYASYFDLSAGTVLTNASGNTATITSVGGGFWKCSVTRLMTGSSTSHLSQAGCSTADNTLSYTGDGTSGIYIFGAQLSDSASVDPYVYQPVAAPTSTAYYGPRFDYDPVTLAPKGLLIEEQRSNLLTYSEQFDNAAWVAVAAGIAANTAVSPSGATTGDSLVPSGVSATHYIYQLIALTLGASYTMTVYAKPNGYNRFMLRESTTAGYFVVFDVSTGTVVNTNSATGTITPAGNGWYRCTMTITAPLTVATVMAIINMPNNGTTYANATFTGDGTSGIYLWGAQLEVGAFATSYIPTVASQVTRAADNASMIGNNFARWYNVNEGTLFAGFDVAATTSAVGMSPVSIATASTNGYLLYKGLNAAGFFAYTDSASASLGNLSVNTLAKAAIAYNGLNNAGVLNGTTPSAITTVAVTTPTQMYIGRSYAGTQLVGHIQRIAYYPRRLANSELTAITS